MPHLSPLTLPLLLPLLLPLSPPCALSAGGALGAALTANESHTTGRASVQQPEPKTQEPIGPALPGAAEEAAEVEREFAKAGIRVDRAAGALSFAASIQVRDDLLEYLLVNPHGAVHEALFVTNVPADWLNVAFLALGLQRGQNVEYVQKDPQPSPEELRAGTRAFDIVPPRGDGVHLYATWREGDEVFFYRIEDLVRDLDRGRTMRRHTWVYLGSRFIESRRSGGEQLFAAKAEGNLACISFFSPGNTLLTAALPECVAQSSWLPNSWLLPPVGSEVLLIASRVALLTPPQTMESAVPLVDPEQKPSGGEGR
jgi:hypothetical protein